MGSRHLPRADLDTSARFYDTVLSTLGVARSSTADWTVELVPRPGLSVAAFAVSGANVNGGWVGSMSLSSVGGEQPNNCHLERGRRPAVAVPRL